ncbi:hypothetical protein [Actinoplanes sp. ATCC 53533]|uniref:hypothetical protein n=1 Tax=Actinoplanes sp. ATCC 53533 TaxID=1288362 RepID=UPI000F7B0A0B|nr:hypothetical protein [Actinoplanes sp. ATCC 53533]
MSIWPLTPDGQKSALVLTNIRGDREREVAPKVANIWLRFSVLAEKNHPAFPPGAEGLRTHRWMNRRRFLL